MPQYNGTGPMGQGPGTGRGAGPCGRGIRNGMGYFGGRCFGFRQFISSKNNIEALENEEKILEEELAAIREEKKVLKNSQK